MGNISDSPITAGIPYRMGTCLDATVFAQFQAVKLTGSNLYAPCATTDANTDVAGIVLASRQPGDPLSIPIAPLTSDVSLPVLTDGTGLVTPGSATVGYLSLSTTTAGYFKPDAEGSGILRAVTDAPAVAGGVVLGQGMPGSGGGAVSVTLQAAYSGGKTIVETTGTNPVAISSPDASATLVTFASSGAGSGGSIQAQAGAIIVEATRELNLWGGDGSASSGYPVNILGGFGVGASQAGANVSILGGNAGATGNANGGNVVIAGGLKVGSGTDGYTQIGDGSGNTFVRVSANAVRMLLDNTVDGDVTWSADASGNVFLTPATNLSTGIKSADGNNRISIDNSFVYMQWGATSSVRVTSSGVNVLAGNQSACADFTFTSSDLARCILYGGNSGSVKFMCDNTGVAFYGGARVAQAAVVALTNSVTAGGSNDVIANYTDLTTYATDAAAIRNNIYQLARKVAQLQVALGSTTGVGLVNG